MKKATSRGFKCYRCLVFCYLILNCMLGLALGIFSSYLLLFHRESHVLKPRVFVLYFLIAPTSFTILSTFVGWSSIKKRNIIWIKFFAVLLATTAILEISGSLWCFASLPDINDQVLIQVKEKFSTVKPNSYSEKWWNNIQSKLKCCGVHGPTDYLTAKKVPISCCGSDPEKSSSGYCSFLWQNGCYTALTNEISQDLIILSIAGLFVAFLQVPGVFISWCFAKRLLKERKPIA